MTSREDRRSEALARIAQHLLLEGLPGSSLRDLAAAAGTSDRMLLYYFADKNEIITLALGMLAAQMALALDQSVPSAPPRPADMLTVEIRQAIQSSVLRPFMRLWLEIAARAARNEVPFNTVAGVIADSFESWISSRLAATHEAESARLLATVEGLVLLDAIGRDDRADAAASPIPQTPLPSSPSKI